jgi:hypothetical protein
VYRVSLLAKGDIAGMIPGLEESGLPILRLVIALVQWARA